MIYVHIPYCHSFCTYCGFYSELDCSSREAFVDAICAEMDSRRGELSDEVNTLYIGGGTPSVLPPSDLKRIVEATGRGGWEEFTIEVNPDDIVRKGPEYARALKDLGVTRVSMGIQSFDDRLLHWMNRRHAAADAEKAVSMLREAGFENISIDLIFGIGDFAGQEFTDGIWESTIGRALDLGCQHISAYQLSIEPDSALEKLLERGKFTPADDEKCARQYEILCSKLVAAGFHHYEISNFALPGFEARHNSAYWRHVPYSGFGPGAHSLLHHDDGSWVRRWNLPDVRAYIQSCPSEGEVLTEEQLRLERIMLGLRTDRGVPFHVLDPSKVGCMVADGKLRMEGLMIRIPEEYFFISDNIIEELT